MNIYIHNMCRLPPDGHSGFYKVVTSWLNLINYVYIYIFTMVISLVNPTVQLGK